MIISVKFISRIKKNSLNIFVDLNKHEYRYDSVQHAIEQRRLNTHGFIIAGHLDEKYFYKKWQEKVILPTLDSSSFKFNLHIAWTNSFNNYSII
jgi:hypothetical protein